MAVAFDVGRKTFRTDMFPAYKAQREATPPEFKGQVEILKEVLSTLGITTIEKIDFEADDVIATLSVAAKPLGFKTLIVTGDRDSFQLVNDTTTVLYPMKGVSVLHRFTPEAVEEKYGLTPRQYPEFAALRGDPSDNLPNIPGVGEKTATKWIAQYETLDNLLDHADEIKGKVGASLRERIEQVRMNRKLTEMVKDLELPLGPDDFEMKPVQVAEVAAKFDDLEFGTNLRERVLAVVKAEGSAAPVEEVEAEQVVVDTQSLAQWLPARAGQALALALAGVAKPAAGDTYALAIADTKRHAVLVDVADISAEDEKALATWLASEDPKMLHGAKAAYHMLAGRGFELHGVVHDTAIAAYLLRPGQRTYELADVYQRHLQRQLSTNDNGGQLTLLDAADDQSLVDDVIAILELSEELTKQLQEIQAFELYHDLEIPLSGILARMEAIGIAVDVATLEEQLKTFIGQVAQEEEAARELAEDPTLNLSSPKQLQVCFLRRSECRKPRKPRPATLRLPRKLKP